MRDWEALGPAAAVLEGGGQVFTPHSLTAIADADPGHDSRLDPEYRAAVIVFSASSLLGERAAAASARRAGEAVRRPLSDGFARQAADEERHAALDDERLLMLGVRPGEAAAITPGVAREMQVSLAVEDPFRRLFLTNLVAETALAGATFPFVIALAQANGDRLSVALNRARLADESRHARFAARTFEILIAQEERNRDVLQRWQDEHFAAGTSAFIEEVAPALDRAPHRPSGDWLGAALAAYRARAARLGLRAPSVPEEEFPPAPRAGPA